MRLKVRSRCTILGMVLALPAIAAPAYADVPPVVTTSACGGTQSVRPIPIAATHLLPPYPPESVRLGEQGNSILKVAIAPSGNVVEDSLVQSSGSDRLDSAALDYVKQNWRWQPMPDCKTPVSLAVSVAWRIRSPAPALDPALVMKLVHFILAGPADYPAGAPKQKAVVLMMGVVSEQGVWQKVMPLRGSGDPVLDAKSVELVQSRSRWSALKLDDKPVGSAVVIGVIWTPLGETPPDPEQIAKIMELFAPHPPPSPP
jgi:TonB family protein